MAEIEALVRTHLANAPETAIVAYLFGSVARGTANAGSDVDLAVLFDPPAVAVLNNAVSQLEASLEHLLGRTVQVIDLGRAPPDLVHRVLRDGKCLLDRNPSARIRFEVQARASYFDLLPFLNRYRRQPHRSSEAFK